jgi:hypothetical protein
MLGYKRNEVLSIEDLITQLEHIEPSELACDIRANVRAELRRMKRNISALLCFLSHGPALDVADNPELHDAILGVRRECLLINGTISKILFLQALRFRPELWSALTDRAASQYGEMAQWACQMCQLAAPRRAQELMAAL